jgi:hypothetical protein
MIACDGFTIGQTVWFIRSGMVLTGVIVEFRPFRSNSSLFWADITTVDDLEASVFTEELFSGEVPAVEWLLSELRDQTAYLRSRLKELARKTNTKAAAPTVRA